MKPIPQSNSQLQDEDAISDRQVDSHITYMKPYKNKSSRKEGISLTYVTLIILMGFLILGIFVYLFGQSSSHTKTETYIKERQQELNKILKEKQDLETKLGTTTQKTQQYQQKIKQISQELQRQKAKKKTEKQPLISTGKSGKLPLKLPAVNKNNQKIQEVLYPDEAVKTERINLHRERIKFISSQGSNVQSANLINYNIILDQADAKLAQTDFYNDWKRLQDKFQLSKIAKELPMCIVVPGYNNNAKFRIQYNLNSIFTQNYSNYRAVIINDASTDGSGDIYRKYFQFYDIDQDHYTYIQNTKRVTALQNIYLATVNHCSKDSIVLNLDADDQFIGRNVLKVINWGYLTYKSGVLYSNFLWYQQNVQISFGQSQEYNENQKKNGLYRSTQIKYNHLRTYRTELFLKINPQDLKDKNGGFYTITYDTAIYMPLMEMSCDRVNKIEGQFHLLYKVGTGLNDYQVNRQYQIQVHNQVISKPRYECNKEFNDKMKNQT